MEKHLTVLSVLYIIFGALNLLGALFVFIALSVAGTYGDHIGSFAMVGATVGFVLASFLGIMSAAGIGGAVGLLQRRRWARTTLLVLSFLNLIHVPFGTALGAYGIWVLMNDRTDPLFAQTVTAPPPVATGIPGH